MILLLAMLIGLAAGLLLGGSFRNLEHLDLRFSVGILALFIAQALFRSSGANLLRVDASVVVFAWCACAAALVVLCFLNRRVPGLWIIGVGMLLNLLVVASNRSMPLSLQAARSIGASASDIARGLEASFYRPVGASTWFTFLGDVIPIPGPSGVRAVVSVGDILMALGVAVVVALGMRRPAHDPSQPGGDT